MRKFIGRGSVIKKLTLNLAARYNTGFFKLFRFPDPVGELRNILIKSMVIVIT